MFDKLSLSIKDSAIMTLDRSGKITGWSGSATRMTGYSSDEMIGHSFGLLYLPQELRRNRPGEALRVASELGRFAEEGIRVRRDGSNFWVAMTILKSRSRWHSDSRFTCVLIDITESVRMRGELMRVREAASAAGGALQRRLQASALAHDLNNILNAMSLRIGMLRAAASTPAEIDNLDRLRHLLGEANNVTRGVQSGFGAQPGVPVSIEPSDLIRATIERVRERVRQRYPSSSRVPHVDLEIGALKTVMLVPEDLSEVLERLILSVCDAMPSGGAVMVDASADPGHLIVAIEQHHLADEGTAQLPRSIDSAVFEAGGISRSLAQSGLIARLGASLRVGDRDGADAVITLSVPAGEFEHPAPISGAAAREPANHNGPGHTRALQILIADDDLDNLDALREGLERKGYIVATAANGYDGLSHLRSGAHFDFVICDIGMPGMNGWELAEQAAIIAPGTQVLLVTGWVSEIGRSDPRRGLVVDVLTKPIDLEVINDLIARAVK
ncbi:MAG: response regulator [Candidatus Binataceae bacterium]